jgi:acyl-coenzyme A thioesterase PaaI-like protein
MSKDVEDYGAPAPFKPSVRRGPFTTHNGPWFHWADGADFRQGVRLLDRHCNSRGIAHGGFLSSFADGLLATAIFRSLQRSAVTVQLTTEFLNEARAGEWLQGTATILRDTRALAFVSAHAWIGEDVEEPQSGFVFTAHAVFRLKERA